MAGSGEDLKLFKKFCNEKGACSSFNFFRGFEFRFLDGEPQAAAGSAAAFVCPFVEGTQQAAAATAGLEEYVRAGAATDLHDAMVTDGVFCLNAFGGHLRFGMETGCGAGAAATDLLDVTLFQDMGKPAAATDLLDAMGSTAIVLGDNGVLHSVCMGTLSAVAAANSFDFEGVESTEFIAPSHPCMCTFSS